MRLAAALASIAILSSFGALGSALAQTPPRPPTAAATATPPAPPPAAPAAPTASFRRYASANEVQIRNFAGFIRVRPENRNDIAIAVINSGPLASPIIRVSGDRLIVDGGLRRQIRSCRTSAGGGLSVDINRRGRVTALPTLELRVPQDVVVAAGGAVRLHVGPAESAHIRLEGCGDADIERVNDEAEISVSGSPDVRLYDAGTATIAVAGSGDVVVGVVRDGLTVSIAGAGDFTASRADGPTSIAIQGAGDVIIRDGRATTLSIAIAGAGDVTHNGSAERLDAAIFGVGDVRVRRVSGEITRRVLGGGEVVVSQR